VLLTEGSSLTAREVVTALGPLGYRIEACDPNPLCLTRFSVFVRRVHRCPRMASDPLGYLGFVAGLLQHRHYDVLLPTHEQAFALASEGERFASLAGVALAELAAFLRLQSKVAFARLAVELGLPQPEFRVARSREELLATDGLPCYVKAAYGTAGRAVWRVGSQRELTELAELVERAGHLQGGGVLVQAEVTGQPCQVQSVFDRGRLVAAHCTARTMDGMGGGAAARQGVDHPAVVQHVGRLGRHVGWHGGLTLDYLVDGELGQPWFIEANPRLVEPMNATLSGVNLADVLARVSLGRPPEGVWPLVGRPGVRSHGTIAGLIGIASRAGTRRDVAAVLAERVRGRCAGHPSSEVLTPVSRDVLSLVPLAAVAGALLLDPRLAHAVAGRAVADYSLSPQAVATLVAHSS
jgi:hypothetical protein